MKTIIITLIIVYIIFEIIEHIALPLLFSGKRKNKNMNDQDGMIGRVVEVKEWKNREGHVSVNGELWRAESSTALVPSSKAVIQDVKGLTLKVELLNEQ